MTLKPNDKRPEFVKSFKTSTSNSIPLDPVESRSTTAILLKNEIKMKRRIKLKQKI